MIRIYGFLKIKSDTQGNMSTSRTFQEGYREMRDPSYEDGGWGQDWRIGYCVTHNL